MADIFSSMGASIGNFAWSSVGNIVSVIVIFLIIIVAFGILFFLMWWKSFNYNVKLYEPIGQQLSKEDLAELKGKTPEEVNSILETKKIRFNHIRYKVTHGRYATIKGVQQFNTFMPAVRLAPVPLNLLYDDGIHLLKLSRDLFVPIKRPEVIIELNANMSIFVEEAQQWQNFNNLLADRINNKYQDLGVQQKIVFYFVVGIVAMVLVGGFVIWLIYKAQEKNLKNNLVVADAFNSVANKIIVGGNTPA